MILLYRLAAAVCMNAASFIAGDGIGGHFITGRYVVPVSSHVATIAILLALMAAFKVLAYRAQSVPREN